MKNLGILILILSMYQSVYTQCLPDRHSTDLLDAWLSCESSMNPNPAHGQSKWLMYDFGNPKNLYQSKLWNINHPDFLADGMKDIIVEISLDQTNWSLVDTITLPRAFGSGLYLGNLGPDFNGSLARYLLLTPVSNYGGGCVGLSEIKVYTESNPNTFFELAVTTCENDGLLRSLSSGLTGGQYSGNAVIDNGNGTFDFDAFKAGVGNHPITYTRQGQTYEGIVQVLPCFHPLCSGCWDCDGYDTAAVNAIPIPEGEYYGHSVESSGQVFNNDQVIFWGGQEIAMMPNFEIGFSGILEADIRLCYDNVLKNAGFEQGTSEWELRLSSGAQANFTTTNVGVYTGVFSGKIDIIQPGTSQSHIELRHNNLTVMEEKDYVLSFYAKSDEIQIIESRFQTESGPSTVYFDEDIEISDHWERYQFEFSSDSDQFENVRLRLRMGKANGVVVVDQFSLAEVRQ